MHALAFAPALLTATAAAEVFDNKERTSANGYTFPSIEYFVDNYFEYTVGFSSSHDGQATVETWIANCLSESVDALGVENTLFLQALCDQLNFEGDRIYKVYDAKYNGSYDMVCEHEAEYDLLTEDNIKDLCDMVRVFILGEDMGAELNQPEPVFDSAVTRDLAAKFVADFGGTLSYAHLLDKKYAYFTIVGTTFARGVKYLRKRFGAPVYSDNYMGSLRSYKGPTPGSMVNFSYSERFGLRIRFVA